MSYAEQVANMLGVKLREAFNIPGVPNMLFMITDEGAKFFNYEDKKWHTSSILSDIFCGSYKNIEKKWKPARYENYYFPTPITKVLWAYTKWVDSPNDNTRYERGLVCKTKEEAISLAKKMLTAV